MGRNIVIAYHNPAVTRSGRWAGERGRQLIAALEGAGATVRAIPAPPRRKPGGSGAGGRMLDRVPYQLRGAAITGRLVQRGLVNTVRWTWRIWWRLRAAKPDVVLARYHEYELTPLVAARLLRRPLVLEVHAPFGLEGTLRGRRPGRLAGWIDRLFWRNADYLWVHTPALAELVISQGADPARVAVVPFGIADPGRVAEPGRNGSRIDVVFAGSFYPWHGVEELLAAFARARVAVPDMHLTLIGDGIVHRDATIQAGAFDLRDTTTFTGWLDRAALYRQLQRSHIAVAPYRASTQSYFQPVKILDYQMAGLPIIASDVGHVRNLIEPGAGGVLVPPGDVEALAAALVELATDPDLRQDLGAAGRRSAQHIDDTARRVVDLCEAAGAA